MNVNFSSHKGTAELDQHIERAIKDNNPSQIFDLVEQLAALPDATYEKYKIRFKDTFKRRLSISGLDKAVREARKNRKRAKFTAKHPTVPAPGTTRPRPIVEVGGQLRDVVQSALATLELWNKDAPTIFVLSGKLVTICFSEKGGPSIAPLTLSSLRHKMTEAADYVQINEGAEDITAHSVIPPLDVVRDILDGITNAADYPFPALAGVTELPIIRPDGSLHQTPGYDPVTKRVYIPGDLIIPPIPETPTKEEVQKSVDLFNYMLADFPFTDKSSKATIIADIITAVIRSVIDGQVPLTLLDAPTPGTGKTLLAKIVGIVATGRVPSIEGPTGDEEEWRKKILTWLMKSPSVIIIDNVHHTLESSTLESALTTPTYGDRLLSTNTNIEVEQRAIWFATGNNIRVGNDMARRCIKCRLDAKSERPHKRDPKSFKIQGKIENWTMEHRVEIVVSALILMRYWYVQGSPEPNCTPLANFEEWRLIIGGILQAAGIPDFLKNLDEEDGSSSIDEATAAWKAFIRTIHDVFSSEPFTFSMLAKRMLDKDEQGELLSETLPTALTKSFDSYQRSQGVDKDFAAHLGNVFRTKKGQVFDGLRLETSKIKATGNKTQWQIVVNDDETSSSPSQTSPQQSDVPQTDTALFMSYMERLRKQKQDMMWIASDNGYSNEMLSVSEHYKKSKSMYESGDDSKKKAALEAINRTLGTYGR